MIFLLGKGLAYLLDLQVILLFTQLRHVLCSILSEFRYISYMISIYNLCQLSMWEYSSVCLDPAWKLWNATLMIMSRSWWRSLAAKIISPIHDKKSDTTTTTNNSNSNNNNRNQANGETKTKRRHRYSNNN